MKKILAILLTAALLTAGLTGCGGERNADADRETAVSDDGAAAAEEDGTDENGEAVTIRIAGLKGPTSMGMVKLLEDSQEGLTFNTYDFTMAGSADEITPAFLRGDLDIIAAPVNLGSVLYNKSEGAVSMLAVNTLGVTYIVEKGGQEVSDMSDLKGMTIYATGKGSIPEYALGYLLEQSGLDMEKDVTVEWKSEPSEIVSLMATMDHAVAMLPQPYVTVAKGQLEGLNVAVDMTEAWNELDTGSRLITAGLFVRNDFLKENPEAVKRFLEEYEASVDYVNENVSEASVLVEKYDIVKAPVAEKAIPFCNIVCISGEEMHEMTKEYFNILCERNPEVLGGALPEDDFYAAEF